MANEISTPVSLQDRIRERVQVTFLDLVSEEEWKTLIEAQLLRFKNVELPKIVNEEADKLLRAQIKQELCQPEWQSVGGYNGPKAGEAVAALIKELAPEMMASIFGSIVQRMVYEMRNNRLI